MITIFFPKELVALSVPKNMIKINGVWIPSPAGLDISLEAVDKYAQRTENGQLQRKMLAKKYKYNLNWEYIPDNVEFNEFWAMLAETGEFFSFVAPTPDGNNTHEMEAYIGPMSTTMMSYYDIGQQRQARWKSFKANIVER